MSLPRTPDTTEPGSSAGVLLVTGCSSGIGLATAVAAARAGWTTVATLRDPSRDQALRRAADEAGVALDVRRLDVTDADGTRACLEAVVADHGRLDAVVNNAGAAHVGTVELDDLETVRACVEVNFFGVVHVTKAALPHLRATSGRLLTVSSVGGAVGQPFNEAYCAAKFAVEGFMQALAPVAATVGVSVGVVEPGAVTSEFVANLGVDTGSLLAEAGPYAGALRTYLDRTAAAFDPSRAQTPAAVADVVVDLLAAAELPARAQTSEGARAFVASSLADLDGSAVQALTRPWVGVPSTPGAP